MPIFCGLIPVKVVANLASKEAGDTVHPSGHVNMSQSSNDVIPTTIHVSAAITCHQQLIPAINYLIAAIDK